MLRSMLLGATLSAALAAGTPAPAQIPERTAPQPALVPQLVPQLGLRRGTVVRVAPVGRPRVEGRLLRTTDSALVLSDAGRERTVRLTPDDSVWVRGRATKSGAVAGGLAGLALTGAAVALFYSVCEAGTDDPCTGQEAFFPLGIGAVGGGALLGAAVGSLFPQWRRRQP